MEKLGHIFRTVQNFRRCQSTILWSANGKNPLWIVVPCHRVIGSDGSLTGYAGGLYAKVALEHENPTTQQSLF
jgi:O-6-methylguanine DNA methyltransferase